MYTPLYILTWNPKRFDWKEYGLIKQNRHLLPYQTNWSCHSTHPKSGDRFILLMQGMGELNGIVASGNILTEPYTVTQDNNTDANPGANPGDNPGDNPFGDQFIDILINKAWDYQTGEHIRTSYLRSTFTDQCFTPQMSGTRVKSYYTPDIWRLIS